MEAAPRGWIGPDLLIRHYPSAPDKGCACSWIRICKQWGTTREWVEGDIYTSYWINMRDFVGGFDMPTYLVYLRMVYGGDLNVRVEQAHCWTHGTPNIREIDINLGNLNLTPRGLACPASQAKPVNPFNPSSPRGEPWPYCCEALGPDD